jgi:hypothetical protein
LLLCERQRQFGALKVVIHTATPGLQAAETCKS